MESLARMVLSVARSLSAEVVVTAGLSPHQLEVHSFCEKALHGPGHASPRSVKITSPTAVCYRLDSLGPQFSQPLLRLLRVQDEVSPWSLHPSLIRNCMFFFFREGRCNDEQAFQNDMSKGRDYGNCDFTLGGHLHAERSTTLYS